MKNIGIIGAGLSGLACALELKKNGHNVTIFDKNSRVGGRVQTDKVDGFLLDHGFQVYLPSYSMGKYFLNTKNLKLETFAPGAFIMDDQGFTRFSDPLRRPQDLFSMISNPHFSLSDKFKILQLQFQKPTVKNISAFQFLEDFGFSQKSIRNFFKPFFSGVFLEKSLEQIPADYFLFIFQQFNLSKASLPEHGMAAIPEQMAEELNTDQIHLNTKVKSVTDSTISTEKGDFQFNHTVLATNANDRKSLQDHSNECSYHGVQTFYFKTQSYKYTGKWLYLTQKKVKHVNHIACLSSVQKTYAPKGWNLFSVNCIGEISDLESVKNDLSEIFGVEEVGTWEFIKQYNISKALPAKVQNNQSEQGVFICGDDTESPSIQGALLSGRKAAQRILSQKS